MYIFSELNQDYVYKRSLLTKKTKMIKLSNVQSSCNILMALAVCFSSSAIVPMAKQRVVKEKHTLFMLI